MAGDPMTLNELARMTDAGTLSIARKYEEKHKERIAAIRANTNHESRIEGWMNIMQEEGIGDGSYVTYGPPRRQQL